MQSKIELGELRSAFVPEPVAYAAIVPASSDVGPVPLCLMLMGGGGTREHLIQCQPLFDKWWSEGALAPMAIATPTAGMSYYVEDADGGTRWESFIVGDLLAHLRASLNVRADRLSTAIAGISMGGYGALKIAFARPELFGVVAAIQPMLEPGLRDADIGARNRIHHTSGGPARLVGPNRDPAFFESQNPANRARANAAAIRESELAIYIEVGDEDSVNAHDGTEFLHRVLWDLDIPHEYHLVRGGDHGGPTLVPRMREAYMWVGRVIGRGIAAEPDEFIRGLRAQLQPLRDQAAEADPSTRRRYGVLPGTGERNSARSG